MRFITPPKEQPVDHSDTQRTLLVIGAGLSRCATTTLQYVFEEKFGLGPALHSAHITPSLERTQLLLAALNEREKAKRQALLHQLVDGYAAVSDVPGWAFVDDLMEMYPSAKVVLNKRARAEDWLRLMKTIEYIGSTSFFAVNYWNRMWVLGYYVYNSMFSKLARVLGLNSRLCSVEMYEAHLNWVRGLAKARSVPLLEWTPQWGMRRCVSFLGRKFPKNHFRG